MAYTDIPRIEGLGDGMVNLPPFLDELPIGILVTGLDRRAVLVNRYLRALTGFGQPAGGIPCKYILRGSRCVDGCTAQSQSGEEGACSCEANIISRDRKKIAIRSTISPIFDSSGNKIGYLEAIEDIRLMERQDLPVGKFFFGDIIGDSVAMQQIYRVLATIAQTDSSVLITGQTGTGKDYIAEAVHNASQRAKGPFIKVNCGALPENLMESELFGHLKGAFTGAVENKPGRFRLAHTGTLYLTEIGDLPVNLQVKLLSFLDDRIIYPLGGSRGQHVDVRLIAATHRDLEEMVRKGQFREDLLFRLNVVRMHLPPLMERGNDLYMLLDYFLSTFNKRFKKKVRQLDEKSLRALLAYPFPGNVRELRNIVEYAVNFCEGDTILLEHLPRYISSYRAPKKETEREKSAKPVVETPEPPISPDASWADTEKHMIMNAMMRSRGNRTKAAQYLGMGRSTLWRKMKAHNMM